MRLLLLRGGLETFVAVAPVFRPRRSFFNLVGGSLFFPFGGAFLLPLARRNLSGALLFFRFGILVRRARLLLRGGSRVGLRHWPCDQSDGERGSKHNLMHEVQSLYFQRCGALSSGNRPQSATCEER